MVTRRRIWAAGHLFTWACATYRRYQFGFVFPGHGQGATASIAQPALPRRRAGVASLGISLWASQRRLARLIRFRQREYYDRAVTEGKRVILLAPHFLVLEIAGLYLSHERPMISMYKAPKNELFEIGRAHV